MSALWCILAYEYDDSETGAISIPILVIHIHCQWKTSKQIFRPVISSARALHSGFP